MVQIFTGQTEHCALGKQIYAQSLFHTKLLLLQFPAITVLVLTIEPFVGIGAIPGFNAQQRTNKTLTTDPFDNTCGVGEVSPEVEAREVTGGMCL